MGSNGHGVFYPHHVPTGLPTFRPYGSPENNGSGVFYPHHVPTGLPTFRPYGSPENNGSGVFYPHRVPTGLWKTPGLLFFSFGPEPQYLPA
jgi:hypothetical protein